MLCCLVVSGLIPEHGKRLFSRAALLDKGLCLKLLPNKFTWSVGCPQSSEEQGTQQHLQKNLGHATINKKYFQGG